MREKAQLVKKNLSDLFMSDVFVTKRDWLGCCGICLPGDNQSEGHKNQRWLSKLKFFLSASLFTYLFIAYFHSIDLS